jgi:hypothetical protein
MIAQYVGLFMICLSCSAPKKNLSLIPSDPKPVLLQFDRGACFGRCPVYSFYLLSDHTALLHAKANWHDTSGWYATEPDHESIAEILDLIESPSWWAPDLRQQPEIADLPSSTLIYYHSQGIRKITVQSRTTIDLQNVFDKINDIIMNASWNSTLVRPSLAAETTQTDVIVQLKPGVDIQQWMKKFDAFGITLKKRLSPNQQYFVVSRDSLRGSSNDFLQHIKSDSEVVDAQWDKELGERERN